MYNTCMTIFDFLDDIGIVHNDSKLIEQAFIHSSYVNEHKGKCHDNERLEFMGDAVLQLFVSEFIFALHPEYKEGQLTQLRSKLVREESLARFSEELHLGELLYLGVGEEKSGGRHRESVLANIYESFIGALYLDCGKEQVIRILEKTIFKHVNEVNEFDDITDYKTKLQELVQSDDRKTVSYHVKSSTGPANAPEFVIEVILDDMILGTGKGTSKKRAEQHAAKDALMKMAKKA